MNQTVFRYDIYHNTDESIVEELESLQFVQNVTSIVSIQTDHPRAEEKTKIRVEVRESDNFEELTSFIQDNFTDSWFDY